MPLPEIVTSVAKRETDLAALKSDRLLGLRLRPDLNLFFKHLERETSRLANTSSTAYRGPTRQRTPIIIQPLAFPPKLTNYPAHIICLVLPRQEAAWTRNY